MLAILSGCLSQGTTSSTSASSSSASRGNLFSSGTVSPTGSTGATQETQCVIFQSNAKDYQTCLGCKATMCPCTLTDTTQCATTSNIAGCTVNFTQLVQCVHDNVLAGGGTCVGLKCGDGQVADFTACVCRDAVPPASFPAAPGQEDTSTPYMEPGLFVSNRYCPPSDIPAGSTGVAIFPNQYLDCLAYKGNAGINSGNQGTLTPLPRTTPRYNMAPPANVFTDVGYLRWDLSLDASQFSPALPLLEKQPFNGTWATFPATVSMFYQLKPNTVLKSTTSPMSIPWNDCAEHFSGSTSGALMILSTNNACDPRTVINNPPASTAARPVPLVSTSQYTGTAAIENMSMNGASANSNIVASDLSSVMDKPGNKGLQLSTPANPLGLGKAALAFDVASNNGTMSGSGLLSNIGYYKYTWGPMIVRRSSTSTTDLASGTVSGRVAMNMNLGYTPASAVESTALSPNSLTGSVSTRDCSTSPTGPHPCVLTSVYRAAGGAVMTQNYSTDFTQSNFASAVSALPTGVVAVSTPKIIEDVSQFDVTTADKLRPARLRVFVRADDGNIYMTRYETGKWASWLSLGRPWVCDSSIALNSSSCRDNAFATQPNPYRPFPDQNAYSGLPNEGLSIAGEPMVASYMDPTTRRGIIGIFVRVSQYKSSNGSYGPYHNAVFYTFARAEALRIPGKPLEFDVPSNWSQWMPIKNTTSNPTLFQIQGNPLVLINDVAVSSGANRIKFYVLGTSSLDLSSGNLLHPPIGMTPNATTGAPRNWISPTTFLGFTAQLGFNLLAGTPVPKPFWFNYGTTLIRTSLDVTDRKSTSYCLDDSGLLPDSTATYCRSLINMPNWATFASTSNTFSTPTSSTGNAKIAAIVSDWTAAPVKTGTALARSDTIRVFANQLTGMNCTYIGSIAFPVESVSPCIYTRGVIAQEFQFDGNAASGLTELCTDPFVYKNLQFFGNVWPVNLSEVTRTLALPTSSNPGDPLGTAVGAGLVTSGSMALFGRSVCPIKSRCDNVNPTVAYGIVKATTECTMPLPATPTHNMYYSSMAQTQAEIPTSPFAIAKNFSQVVPYYVTSDVVPFFSKPLDVSSNDMPVFLITRDLNGRISNGVFQSSQGGAGSTLFNLQPVGAFTN